MFRYSDMRELRLFAIAQFGEYLVGDVYLGRTEDDALVAGTVEHKLVAPQVGNVADGGVDFFLNRSHQGCALLEELTLGTEVLLLQFCGLFLLLHDSILTGFLLLLREEDNLVLIVLIEGLRLYLQCVNLGLPLLGHLIELFVGSLVGRDVLEDIVHVDKGNFCAAALLMNNEQ